MTAKTTTLLLAVSVLIGVPTVFAAAAPHAPTDRASANNERVILQLRENMNVKGGNVYRYADVSSASIWRYYDVWRTDVVKKENGSLVDVDMLTPVMRKDKDGNLLPMGIGSGAVDICPARHVMGSPYPADGWQQPDFDDGDWNRVRDIQRPTYRSTALSCLRGKFEVTDPNRVSDMNLHLGFRGGAVVYMNGQEVGRVGMPTGNIAPDTLA